MATNQVFDVADQLSVACTEPATPASGDPVLFGQLPGVALTDEGDGGNAATDTTVKFSGVYEFEVKAENNAGNIAVAAGDILYYDSAAVVKINKDNTNGVRFGIAMAAIASGATATIAVRIGY